MRMKAKLVVQSFKSDIHIKCKYMPGKTDWNETRVYRTAACGDSQFEAEIPPLIGLLHPFSL
jgi:hypothetical protein